MSDHPATQPPIHPSILPSFQSSSLPIFHLFDELFLRKLERLAILSRRATVGHLQGERRSPKRGQSVEFADFRPYVPGDDLRRVDWNAYARLERFFLKLFVEEEDLTLHLLVDTSRSMQWGQPNKLWYTVRAAAALGYIGLVGLDRVTITALGSGAYFPPHRGKQQALALFAFLQTLIHPTNQPVSQPSSEAPPWGNLATDLSARLRAYAATASQTGPLLLFSDLMDEGWAEGLRALAARGFEVSVLHILAPDEVEPETSAWLSASASRDFKLLDIESGGEVEITADHDLLRRYRQGLTAWQAELRQFCHTRGMHYAPIQTSLPFEELLFAMLRRQGVLK